MNAEGKSRYFEEVARNLRRGGYEPEAMDDDGLLPVRWQAQPLCRVTAEGGVRYLPDNVQRVGGDDAGGRIDHEQVRGGSDGYLQHVRFLRIWV